MANVMLHGNLIHTEGTIPQVGDVIKDFLLTAKDLTDKSISDYKDMRLVLNIFPSVDTDICASSVRTFNKKASSLKNTEVLCISKDLPFAQERFCGSEGLSDVVNLSAVRNSMFGIDNGVQIIDGPLEGLFARAVIVVNEKGVVVHSELVEEIASEPNYEKALSALQG